MEKMYLIPHEEYHSLKEGKGSDEPNDVKLAKFQDAYIRGRDGKDIKESRNWEQLSSRLKPILSTHQADLQEMLKQFPSAHQDQAQFVLSFLSRLPKVTLSPKHLMIDGQALNDSLVEIVMDIMRNDIQGVESLISFLRRGVQNDISMMTPFQSLASNFPSLSNTLTGESTERKQLFASPKNKSSPKVGASSIKTPSRADTPQKTPTPTKVQRTPLGKVQHSPRTPLGKVQHSPRTSKRSPVILQVLDAPPPQDVKEKGKHYWVSW